MLYLGIDQHATQLTVNIRDETGDAIERRQVSTREPEVRQFLEWVREQADLAGGYMAVLEVCGFNDWLIERLKEYGCREIVLVQPEHRPRQKTDRRDAAKLSELLWINRYRLLGGGRAAGLRRVEIASQADDEDRRLTARRQRAGSELTRTINRVKHLLRRHNLQHDCPTRGIQTNKARTWLEQLQLSELDRQEMDDLLKRWDLFGSEITRLEKLIRERAAGNIAAKVLMTIPGVAEYTGLALACRIGNIQRFPRPASLANYWGVAPGIDQSGDPRKGRVGSITKQGSATARFLLGQVVMHVIRKDPQMRSWYRSVRKRRGTKIARVAVMRRLATIIWHMLRTGEAYRGVASMRAAA